MQCFRSKKTGEIAEFIVHKRIEDSKDGNQVYAPFVIDPEEWEDMPEEEWRDILGFEELYQVSSYGNVRTIKKDEAEMSQQENRNGYMTVHLRDKGIERRAMVHRLVAEAFIPNPNELRDVNHKNGDKSDNRVDNLEWASHSDNMTHSFRELGKNVRHIVQLDLDNNFIERWNSITEASEATGICKTDIGECCRGNRKHTKGYKWEYEEDYEEPKEYWYVYGDDVMHDKDKNDFCANSMKAIGNYFETKEEAEKAVEKLKAWKRLKDKGFRFLLDGETEMPMFVYSGTNGEKCITSAEESKQCRDDIKLLFGGEE